MNSESSNDENGDSEIERRVNQIAEEYLAEPPQR